ncbi:hypothetical protein TNCV_4287511 [Trichonephila clavipes]|uniref:Uncharacterized protein n=1 Tax=Trichonephila clavipes TaxID=2585209 RepID=A0A8X6SAT1_TRICX|nr:hypothetical protein TNCV_4287511 [Trichonephila clavipes]
MLLESEYIGSLKSWWELLFIYLSKARAWLLDHLMPNLPVPTDNDVSILFIESSALEHVSAIHSGMAVEQAGFVSI